MICIYAIRNKIDNKVYIGKTSNFHNRIISHKYCMRNFSKKGSNRHLYYACQKYGISSFEFLVLEKFEHLDETLLGDRELHWMIYYKSTDRQFGYNLRLDSSTRCVVHPETRAIQRNRSTGKNNPNFGNKWTNDMKKAMSDDAKNRHANGECYGEEWKKKISAASVEMWKDEDRKRKMAAKVSARKQKYRFRQLTKEGELVRVWESVAEIVDINSGYKWQNIYSVCNGYKKSYMGFVWEKELK